MHVLKNTIWPQYWLNNINANIGANAKTDITNVYGKCWIDIKIELVRVFFILFSNLAISGNTYIKINARTTLTIVNINLNIILIVLSDIKLHK